jgi:hypothetical protein
MHLAPEYCLYLLLAAWNLKDSTAAYLHGIVEDTSPKPLPPVVSDLLAIHEEPEGAVSQLLLLLLLLLPPRILEYSHGVLPRPPVGWVGMRRALQPRRACSQAQNSKSLACACKGLPTSPLLLSPPS